MTAIGSEEGAICSSWLSCVSRLLIACMSVPLSCRYSVSALVTCSVFCKARSHSFGFGTPAREFHQDQPGAVYAKFIRTTSLANAPRSSSRCRVRGNSQKSSKTTIPPWPFSYRLPLRASSPVRSSSRAKPERTSSFTPRKPRRSEGKPKPFAATEGYRPGKDAQERKLMRSGRGGVWSKELGARVVCVDEEGRGEGDGRSNEVEEEKSERASAALRGMTSGFASPYCTVTKHINHRSGAAELVTAEPARRKRTQSCTSVSRPPIEVLQAARWSFGHLGGCKPPVIARPGQQASRRARHPGRSRSTAKHPQRRAAEPAYVTNETPETHALSPTQSDRT